MRASLAARAALPMLAALAALAAASCGGGGGGGSVTTPAGPGTVTVLSPNSCPSGPGGLPGTACAHLRIEVVGLAPIEVELRVLEPTVPLIGTVLMSSGNLGTEFYADLGGEGLLQELADAGFRVVDRKWTTGWFASGGGVRPQSARYATLLQWVHDTIHTTGAFCATGNSGGSAEIAYALTAWNAEQLLDVAVPTGGPPFTRLDWLCTVPSPPEWTAECPSIVPGGALTCGTPECNLQNEPAVCDPIVNGAPPTGLAEDSVLFTGADVDWPATLVHVLLGSEDCTPAVPLALWFVQNVTDPITLEFVPNAPHFMPSSQEGRDAIVQALVTAVTGAPAPSSFDVQVTVEQAEQGLSLSLEALEPGSGRVLERIEAVAD